MWTQAKYQIYIREIVRETDIQQFCCTPCFSTYYIHFLSPTVNIFCIVVKLVASVYGNIIQVTSC